MKVPMDTTDGAIQTTEMTTLVPTAEELAVLSPFERFAFRLTWRMNRGGWKRFWTFCQRTLGAGWIHVCTYNLMRVSGLEHLAEVSHERPLLLVANHRYFFDMYVVSTVLFSRTRWRKQLFFPVRGRFFYDTIGGLLVETTYMSKNERWLATSSSGRSCETDSRCSSPLTRIRL